MKALIGKTVLIVDDEVDLCDMVADEFKFAGAKVFQANSGEQALEVLKKNPIDVILSDINMPNGDGMYLLKSVKSMNHNIPVVLLLTGFSNYSVEEAYDAGAEGIFSKPCDLDLVMQHMLKLLQPIKERFNNDRYNIPNDFKIGLEVESLLGPGSPKLFNISRGGMFIACDDHFPTVEQSVNFKIKFKTPEHGEQQFIGSGTCRWVRKSVKDESSVKGFGLEIVSLDESSLNLFLKLVDAAKILSFIPKDAA